MLFLFRPFVIDDTYITFRYAQNLVDAGVASYNADDGAPVEGYTSFLWLVIAAVAIRANADPLVVVRVFSVFAGIGAIVLLRLLALRLCGDRRLSLLPPVLLAVSAEFAMWTVAGLETTFFVFLLLLSLHLLFREVDRGGTPLWAVSFALLALTRPEGVAFFAAAFVYRFAVSLREPLSPRRRAGTLLFAAFLFTLVYGPYFLWRYSYYHLPLPNTFYAKHGGGRGADYVTGFLAYCAPVVLLALAAPFATRRSLRDKHVAATIVLLWAIVLIDLAAVWNVRAAMAWDWRLLIHLAPLFFVAAVVPLSRFATDRGRVRRMTVAAITIFLVAWTAHPDLLRGRIADCRATGDGLRAAHIELGRLLGRVLEPGTPVVLVDSGAIAYYSKLPCIDIAGIPLNNRALTLGIYEEQDLWAAAPGGIALRGTEEGAISDRPMYRRVLESALKRGFIRYTGARYKDDYYIWVFVDPSRLIEKG